MDGPSNTLIPLRNNAAGKMTGLEVFLRNLITEYFPQETRSKGFNVRGSNNDKKIKIKPNSKITLFKYLALFEGIQKLVI